MLILSLVQIAFASAALVFCIAACRGALRGNDSVGFHLMLSGGSAAVFFISVPQIAPELPLIAVVTAFTGMLLAPHLDRMATSVSPHLGSDDDLDVGESTATRRLRK